MLPAALEACGEAWVITGTGHHTNTRSHQRSAPGGVLHAEVEAWLQAWEYTYSLGKDKGGHSGAFLVHAT